MKMSDYFSDNKKTIKSMEEKDEEVRTFKNIYKKPINQSNHKQEVKSNGIRM